MRVATFNINSVNARLSLLTDWLEAQKPDIVLLQEIKTEYNAFPFFEINAAGYQATVLGQKGYNGVAVLSKKPIKVRRENLPGFEDFQSRYLEVETENIVFSSVYMPNGNPLGSEKYTYKLNFMDAFYNHISKLLQEKENIVLGGDFNVILSSKDVYDESRFKNDALCSEEARKKLTALKYLGLYDAFSLKNKKDFGYTYWDYGPTAFMSDWGLRIDFLFCSASMAERLRECFVDKQLRKQEKPSDHTALIADFEG